MAQTVIVTGGSQGIGKAISEELAGGAKNIVIADINLESARTVAKDLDSPALAVQTDVSSEDDVIELFESAIAEFGSVEILINNAGISQESKPIAEQSLEDWQQVIDVHLLGTFVCSKYFFQQAANLDEACIVNIASVAGYRGFPQMTAYGPAKSAIMNLTQVLAMDGAESEIRVNAVAPGYISTDMVKRVNDEGKFDISELEERTPLGRLGKPEEIAKAVQFLVSQDAKYITGITLPVDGGWSSYGYV